MKYCQLTMLIIFRKSWNFDIYRVRSGARLNNLTRNVNQVITKWCDVYCHHLHKMTFIRSLIFFECPRACCWSRWSFVESSKQKSLVKELSFLKPHNSQSFPISIWWKEIWVKKGANFSENQKISMSERNVTNFNFR